VEDIESHLPLRVRRYELRTDAMGYGRWRGGLGAVREFELLAAGGVSVEGDGHQHRPWGLGGGAEGHPATLRLISDGIERALSSKMPYRQMRAGDRFLCIGPCGGGYGPAAERAPEAVRQDVLDGLLSAEAAAQHFGVVLDETLEVDAEATDRARASL